MNKSSYTLLQDVVMDADFPDLDLALRRGRHVDRDEASWYALLSDAQELLEPYYRRYGCELIHKTDGYFYLLPTGEKLSRKHLSVADMITGQALALMYLDPALIDRGGRVTQEEIVAQLSGVLGSDGLIAAFNPGPKKRKRIDERIAQRNVRKRVAEGVRRLAGLGFVELGKDDQILLRSPLMRFAEPVRGLSEPTAALAELLKQGEVVMAEADEASGAEDEAELDASVEGPAEAAEEASADREGEPAVEDPAEAAQEAVEEAVEEAVADVEGEPSAEDPAEAAEEAVEEVAADREGEPADAADEHNGDPA